ncbi:LpxI family protein [Litorisediminicola beolgyonensis]|uniref:LpxI family protein n=1 Tax=Litorisediminicola beolgyonensis TaxID=1173614 RepID=A0ABW3ZG60_9RHOB
MLALIAGRGRLPQAVAGAQVERPLVAALDGFLPDDLTPDMTFRLETLGSLFETLRARGVTRVCLCGAIRRPQIDPSRIDAATAPLVPRLTEALGQGDDGALRRVMALFEEAGFALLAAHEAAPSLLPDPGVPTRTQPPAIAKTEARVGDGVLAQQGAADLGQACVIRGTEVLAQEDDAGTDAMLARLGQDAGAGDPVTWLMDTGAEVLDDTADWLSGRETRSGMLYKGPKPGQDRRADLPAIGPGTAKAAAEAGLAGLCIEAGGVMVLDRDETLRRLDRAGLYLWVRAR